MAVSRRLTLTFDNGPTRRATTQVLDILAERDLKTTFFVVGHLLARPGARELSERAVAEGHQIGNHTYTHELPTLGNRTDLDHPRTEIAATQELIGDLAHADRYFRPFGDSAAGPHLLSQVARDHLVAHEYSVVLWNAVPRDFEHPQDWPERAWQQMEEHDWTLLVLHDVPTGAMDALPRFLDRVQQADVEITQDFPPDLVPLRCGEVTGRLQDYVAATT